MSLIVPRCYLAIKPVSVIGIFRVVEGSRIGWTALASEFRLRSRGTRKLIIKGSLLYVGEMEGYYFLQTIPGNNHPLFLTWRNTFCNTVWSHRQPFTQSTKAGVRVLPAGSSKLRHKTNRGTKVCCLTCFRGSSGLSISPHPRKKGGN